MIQIGGVCSTFCQADGILLPKKIAIQMGGVLRYFSKASGLGVDVTLLILVSPIFSKKRVYPYPLGAGSARPNPKMGAPDPENPLFLGFSVLRGGSRPWSETMVSEGARPWGRGRSGDNDI